MFSFLRRKKTVNIPSWTKESIDWMQFTPDAAKLSNQKYILVFVYNEMMDGHREHDFVRFFAGHAFTASKMSLFKGNPNYLQIQEGAQPTRDNRNNFGVAIQKKFDDTPFERIKGEIYGVPPGKLLFDLDNYYKNGVVFQRKRIKLLYPYTEQHSIRYRITGEETILTGTTIVKEIPRIETIEAWVYLGIQEYWDRYIDDGFWFRPVRTYKTLNKYFDQCYYWTHKEYKKD